MKKLFSLLVLAAFVFSGTAMFADNKTEAAVKISRVAPNINGNYIKVKDSGLGEGNYLDLSKGYMRVEVESDSAINQRSAFVGSSSSPYSLVSGVTVRNISNSMRNGKYYSIYEVKPTSLLFQAKTPQGSTIHYTLQFSAYNLATSQTDIDRITIRFAP